MGSVNDFLSAYIFLLAEGQKWTAAITGMVSR